MKTDQYGRTTVDTNEAVEILLKGFGVQGAFLSDDNEITQYNKHSADLYDSKIKLASYDNIECSVADYYRQLSTQWNIPDKYKAINIKEYLTNKCETEEEIDRVNMEYELFAERELIPLLQFTIYLVDYMRDNNHFWGVGRGSSVSSYCLYLIGIHKIHSIKYDLDVTDFLK